MIKHKTSMIYGNVLYISIDISADSKKKYAAGEGQVLLSHEDFRLNKPDACYNSVALTAIESSKREWLFFDYGINRWEDPSFSFSIKKNLEKWDDAEIVVYDENLPQDAELFYTDSGDTPVYDFYGWTPSNLLIRKSTFLELISNVYTLYPYPLRKVVQLAESKGIKIHKAQEQMPNRVLKRECLPVFAGKAEEYKGKKLLVITHELSRTGAPLVLAEACINVLKKQGYKMLVLSPFDGPVKKMFVDNGIPVMIQPDLLRLDSTITGKLAVHYDAVILSTTVPYASIQILNEMDKKVLWWIHECKEGYNYVKDYLPEKLSKNILPFCGGQYAKDVLKEHFPDYPAEVLLYGIKDRNPERVMAKPNKGKKLLMCTVASIEERKGQDIFAKAIRLLDDRVRKRCDFLFIGNVNHPNIYESIDETVNKYPENVRYQSGIPREELDKIYQKMDCVVCSSRDDPMPAFVTEAMMFGKPAICSRHTGTAGVLKNGVSGFIYEDDSPQKLADAITRFVGLTESQRSSMGVKARECYDTYFSMPSFERNMKHAIEKVIGAKNA